MLYSYVPSQLKCRIFGVELRGLSRDSMVSIERIDPTHTFRKAMDGSHTAFIDSYGSYRVTINVEQVSESNEFLHTLYKLQQRAGINLKMPLTVEEVISNGGSQFQSFETFFESEPNSEYSSESSTRSWTFVCHNASYSLKGSVGSSSITEALRATIRMIELSEAAGIDLSNIEDQIDRGIIYAEERLKNLI